MDQLIISQNLLIANLISYRHSVNWKLVLHRYRKRKRLVKLLLVWEQTKPQRKRPRCWSFIRNTNFLDDSLDLPDDQFCKKFRFSKQTVFELVESLTPFLKKQNLIREPIGVLKRVVIGLYSLKSGSDFSVIADVFGVSKTSVCRILDEFLDSMLNVYSSTKIKFPVTPTDQEHIVSEFEDIWQFPNTIGALDGSHIPILTPSDNGADYYNYKNWHSVVLMGIVDSHYRFLWISAGQPGKCSDGGVWEKSCFSRNTKIIRAPYHLVADSAFPLSTKILKPFPGDDLGEIQNNFNYRLSRARMPIEGAFGRLKGRFRILLKRCDWSLEKIVKCINVCCILHNIAEEGKQIFLQNWLKKVEDFERQFPQPHGIAAELNINAKYQEGHQKRCQIALQLI